MKQDIRFNTFETNSSSMHSLVVTKSCRQYTHYELNFGHEPEDKEYNLFDICYDDPQFERFPFQVLRTPREKLMYYIGWYIGGKKDKDKEQMVLKFLSDKLNLPIKNINIKLSDDNWIDEETDSYPRVYPNDTGEDVFECLEKHNVPFEEFIMDPRYTVIIDGDEYGELEHMFECNLIDISNIDYISSGIDFWDKHTRIYSMYFLNILSDKSDWRYKEFSESCKNELLDPYYTKFIIEDFDNWAEDSINKDSLNILKECLKSLKSNRKTPIKIELILNKNKKDAYKEVLDIVDEIKDED